MVLAAGGRIVIQHKAVPVPKSTLCTFRVQDWLLSTVTTFAHTPGPLYSWAPAPQMAHGFCTTGSCWYCCTSDSQF
ncbi:hypothetical protein PAL_GLEAN10006849 [Pteropus alecto]|uniref:Uncharacterized protein n=1 Tax=Pteropus alecto TaxID=9402 RepID=L5L539_PTEAL|nr:hypothetical protein PAL_GLEAN10006849 [Pteropus alecto]